jgi:hypothetical protein
VNGSNVFAAPLYKGIYLSRDNGISWIPKNDGLASLYISSLAISDTTIYAGTSGYGVFKCSLSDITAVKMLQNDLPTSFKLLQNYPNPFNPAATINYQLPINSFVTLKVYDALGREVATLVNAQKPAGNYSVEFNGGRLASGIYYYRMNAGSFVQTKKLLLIK